MYYQSMRGLADLAGEDCAAIQTKIATFQRLANKKDKSKATRASAASQVIAYQNDYNNCVAANAAAAAVPVLPPVLPPIIPPVTIPPPATGGGYYPYGGGGGGGGYYPGGGGYYPTGGSAWTEEETGPGGGEAAQDYGQAAPGPGYNMPAYGMPGVPAQPYMPYGAMAYGNPPGAPMPGPVLMEEESLSPGFPLAMQPQGESLGQQCSMEVAAVPQFDEYGPMQVVRIVCAGGGAGGGGSPFGGSPVTSVTSIESQEMETLSGLRGLGQLTKSPWMLLGLAVAGYWLLKKKSNGKPDRKSDFRRKLDRMRWR